MKPEYIHTFCNRTTGKECLCNIFLEAKEDEQKFVVFKKHKSYRKAVEAKVREWVHENWNKWVAESPHWFVSSKVPKDMRPAKRGGRRNAITPKTKLFHTTQTFHREQQEGLINSHAANIFIDKVLSN